MARQRPAESWNQTEEAPTSTSTASASLWEREARDGRKWGDVKTGRVGTAGRAKARKGDWAATWVPRQARNKTRDNNFRIPPPAHDVGGKDAEASVARHALPPFSSRWSRAWRLPVFLYCTGHSRVEKATSEVPALLAGHTSGVRRKPTHERDSATPVVPNRAGTRPVRQGKPSGIGPVVCKGQRIGRCPEPCDDVPAWGRAPGGDWLRRVLWKGINLCATHTKTLYLTL